MPVCALFVALGDSTSIDDYAGGPGRGAVNLLHVNRDADFPDWAGRDQHSDQLGIRMLARDGATSAVVLRDQVPLLPAQPALVTITMGGNDILSCFGDTAAGYAAIDRMAAVTDAVLTRLRSAGECRSW
jgi:hypothetical protein